jgi:hypothetical protein
MGVRATDYSTLTGFDISIATYQGATRQALHPWLFYCGAFGA